MSMVVGFILISSKPGKEKDVYTELLNYKSVVEIHPLFGQYDIIAKVTAEDYDQLGKIIVDDFRALPDVLETKTLAGVRL
jgi:DNA-binding Lrp family transcriptional regulator